MSYYTNVILPLVTAEYFTFLSCLEHFLILSQYESNKLGGGYLSWSKLGGVNFSWSKLGGLKLTRPMWGV